MRFPDKEWQSQPFYGGALYRDILLKTIEIKATLSNAPVSQRCKASCHHPISAVAVLLATYYSGHSLEIDYTESHKTSLPEFDIQSQESDLQNLDAFQTLPPRDRIWLHLANKTQITYGQATLFCEEMDHLIPSTQSIHLPRDYGSTSSCVLTPLFLLWAILRGIHLYPPDTTGLHIEYMSSTVQESIPEGPDRPDRPVGPHLSHLVVTDLDNKQDWPNDFAGLRGISVLLVRGHTLWGLAEITRNADSPFHLQRMARHRPKCNISVSHIDHNPLAIALPQMYKTCREEQIHEISTAIPLSSEKTVTHALVLLARRYPVLQYVASPNKRQWLPCKKKPTPIWIHAYKQGDPEPTGSMYLSQVHIKRLEHTFRLDIRYTSGLVSLFPILEKVREFLERLLIEPDVGIYPDIRLPHLQIPCWNPRVYPSILHSLIQKGHDNTDTLQRIGGICRMTGEQVIQQILEIPKCPLSILWEVGHHPRVLAKSLEGDAFGAYITLLMGQLLDRFNKKRGWFRGSVLHIHRLETKTDNRWLSEIRITRPPEARTQQYLCVYQNGHFTHLSGRVDAVFAEAIAESCF